ncbi:MAG: gamma-glutamylcyclotransferase [Coleofasciculaceae cyanobacterium]
MNNLKIFVYGTLKPGESNYQRFCAGKVVVEEKAIAYGQLFALSLGYPGMTIGKSLIQGFVLTFADAAILSILDELEDYDPNRPETENEYNRQLIETFDLSGKSLGMVWVYLMSLERVEKLGGVRIDSGCWGV